MCAICGIVNYDAAHFLDPAAVQRMTAALAHRGPDDEGFFIDGHVGLGHRRLSIIDLSGGGQPIFNEDRTAVIIFNGEIYNYRDLAATLTSAGHTFQTRSDTETILHAYEQYGDDCVSHLRGMFAFAIWDGRNRRLLLARDRLGIKPLYYYAGSSFLAFASEIKSLLELPEVPREMDPEALDVFLSLRYVPGPRTIFKNIFRLQPGHILTVDEQGVRTRRYWDIAYPEPEPRPAEHFLERFQELAAESVRLRLIAEVPLGVFLSGGLDSSAVLAMMSRVAGGDRIKTFSVGYEASSPMEEEANEFEYARLATREFAVDHHECRLNAHDFETCLPRMVWHLDEPMADPTCIPLYFLSRAAREHITVVLSGEGADEILAGYGIYPRMLALDRLYQRSSAAQLAPWLARLTPWEKLRHYMRMAGLPLEARYRGVCRGVSPEMRPRLMGPDRALRSDRVMADVFAEHFAAARRASPLNRMLYVDAKVWLPDDLLIKADKMTMACGLELRVPFLDHKLVEFAATLPGALKLNGVGGKVLLRRAMRGVVPDAIVDRSKKGFPTPLASWLRGPLRSFSREALVAADSACGHYLDRSAVAEILDQHEQGRADRSHEIWTLLVFELWHRIFIEKRLRPAAARDDHAAAVAA